MERNYIWVVGLAALVSVGLFIGGVVITSDWPSLWGGHMTDEDPWSMMEDHWGEEEWEGWHSDMHDHMEDHWGEEECHVEIAEWHHMHDHGDEDECHEEVEN